MALGTAFRAFFAALFHREVATQIARVLDEAKGAPPALPAAQQKSQAAPSQPSTPAPPQPSRSEAITLLAALQRESRLVDLIQEKLDQFSDAQVGAAARPCLQQCAATLERLFGLEPIREEGEGSTVELEEGASPARYQWIGEGSGQSGKLVHHGWLASRVDLPEWTGPSEDRLVVAPAQIER
jgi:hypothetical protein